MSTEYVSPHPPAEIKDRPSVGSSRALLAVLFFLLVGYPFLKYGFIETWGYVGDDFDVFCLAAERLKRGESPYPPEVLENQGPTAKEAIYGEYIYPALFARLMTPFTYLPRFPAKLVYLFLSLVLYAWLVFPWEELRKGQTSGAYVRMASLLGWAPVIQNFRFGQSNLVPLLLFAGAWRVASSILPGSSEPSTSRREWLAGFLFGLGSTVKLTPLLLLPFLLAARRGRLFVGVISGLGIGLLASGPRHTYVYFTQVFPLVTELPGLPNSYSLSAFLDLLSRSFIGTALGGLLVAILYLATLLFVWQRRDRLSPPDCILLGCWIPALFAGLWLHHYVVAVLPLSLVLADRVDFLLRTPRPEIDHDRLRSRIRVAVAVILLLPGFNYWYPVKELVDTILRATGYHHAQLFVPGFAAASFFLIPSILSGRNRNA